MVYECVLPYTFARLAHSLEDGLHKLCLRYVMQAVGSLWNLFRIRFAPPRASTFILHDSRHRL